MWQPTVDPDVPTPEKTVLLREEGSRDECLDFGEIWCHFRMCTTVQGFALEDQMGRWRPNWPPWLPLRRKWVCAHADTQGRVTPEAKLFTWRRTIKGGRQVNPVDSDCLCLCL